MIADETVRTYLGIAEDDADTLALAVAAADRVLTWIENVTGRHFREPKEFTLRVSGDGTTAIWLPELPTLDESESIAEYVLAVATKKHREWTAVPEEDYELIPGKAPGPHLLEHEVRWPIGRRNIEVVFEAGYEVGGLPGDIEQLVLEMLAHRYRERGKEGLRSETIGGYSYTRSDAGGEDTFRDAWKSTIEVWRLLVFA